MLASKLSSRAHCNRCCKLRTRVLLGHKAEFHTEVVPSPDVVVDLPPTRKPVPAPTPVPVIHSRAFILHHSPLPVVTVAEPHEADSGREQRKEITSIKDVIQRMDEQLNQIEANPPPIQKALYQVSRGPVGEATSAGISAAARLTVAATREAAKVAAPVGKWMLQEGMKAAMRMAAQAMEGRESEKTGTMKLKRQGRK